jgi:hypothetical protein
MDKTHTHQNGYSDSPVLSDYANTGRRATIEFYCQECDHYLYVRISLALDGNHIIRCPNCNHKHYRLVRRGIITKERFDSHHATAAEVRVPKSACVPKERRRQLGLIAHQRATEAAGLAK